MTSLEKDTQTETDAAPELPPVPPPPTTEADDGTAARAAFDEATNDDIRVTFRGETFTIPRARMSSARFLLAIKTNELHSLLFEAIGRTDAARFIDLCKEGDQLTDVAEEFFAALNKETGQGNS